MTSVTDGSQSPGTKAKSIIKTILQQDDPATMRENLRLLMDTWLLEYDPSPVNQRHQVFSTFTTLTNALKEIEEWSITQLDKKAYQRRVAEAEEYLLQLKSQIEKKP